MLLNIEHIRQLNSKNEDMSYMIIQKSLERFFYDLMRNYGVLNQRYILIDSSYIPYQHLSINIIERIIYLLEKELGYSIIVQKVDNRAEGYVSGDLIQIYLFDPLDFSEHDVNVITNSITSQTIYSGFTGYNNITGNMKRDSYLTCNNTKYLLNE